MDKLKLCEVGQVKFDAQGNREATIIGSGHWAKLVNESGLTGSWLALLLAPVDGINGADWSLLEETQESLREHMLALHDKDTALAAAEARIAELEKALEPFARDTDYRITDDTPVTLRMVSHLTVGDLRRAAALLKEKE